MSNENVSDDFLYDVLVCTYNGEKYIESQIRSILQQKIRPRKIIISDDGSTDATLEICISCFNIYEYSDFQIINGPRQGIANNFFHGAKFSTSEYLFFADQDDIWCDNKVAVFFDYFRKCNQDNPVLIFSDSYVTDDKLNILSDSFIQYSGLNTDILLDDSILLENCVQGASSAINYQLRDLLLDSLGCVEMNSICMHDWWFAILAKYFGVVKYIDTPLLYYRQHYRNIVGAKKKSSNYISHIINIFPTIGKVKKIIRQMEQVPKVSNHLNIFNSPLNPEYTYQFKHVVFFKKLIFFLYRYIPKRFAVRF